MTFYWVEQEKKMPDKPLHPSVQWARWRSDDRTFKYWDKDAAEEKPVVLPDEMIIVAIGYSIWGYVNALWAGVRSNEIYDFDDPFIVRKNNGEIWLKGTWKEIWEAAKAAWAKLTNNVHYTTKDSLEMRTFQLSWAGTKAWIDSIKNIWLNPEHNLIHLKEVAEAKKGRVNYTYPVFENIGALDQNSKNLQKAFAEQLIKHNMNAKKEIEEELRWTAITPEDWLPF